MLLKDFKGFQGLHCETTVAGSLLYSLGMEISEPLLFGLGEGISYIIQNPKERGFPFIGGRIPTDLITKNLCANLALDLTLQETSCQNHAWHAVKSLLDKGTPVGLKLDCYHLEYFENKYHFAGHYVAMYGYDDTYGYLVDTVQQGRYVKSSLESIARARNERGPMSSRNMSYTIGKSGNVTPIKDAVHIALRNNAEAYLDPHTDNVGYNGIGKTALEIETWFARSNDVSRDFKTAAVMMERAGTGGALFRNLYRDFLLQAYELVKDERIKQGHRRFVDIADLWTRVSSLFNQIGERPEDRLLKSLSTVLHDLSDREAEAMELLADI
jgi:hypothetical protein